MLVENISKVRKTWIKYGCCKMLTFLKNVHPVGNCKISMNLVILFHQNFVYFSLAEHAVNERCCFFIFYTFLLLLLLFYSYLFSSHSCAILSCWRHKNCYSVASRSRNQIQQLKQCNFVSSRMHNNDEYPVDVIKQNDATNKDQTEWFS